MRTKRKMYRKTRKSARRSRKNRQRGGFFNFFGSPPKVVPAECDPNNLSQLKTSEQLRANYQTCCPKTFFGMRKNSSPYCKQVELNAKAAIEGEGMQKQFAAADVEPVAMAEMNAAPMTNPVPLPNPANVAPPEQVSLAGGRRRRRTRRRKTRRYRR